MENWERKVRILTKALIFSGAVNIGLMSTFFYLVLRERQIVPLEKMEPKVVKKEITSQEVISSFSTMSFRELLTLLISKEHVEEGYLKRDLALGSLVQHHHFAITKALGNPLVQTRKIRFMLGDKLTDFVVFAGLSDADYEAVLRFAYTEKWPFTAEGLFSLLQKSPKPRDVSLEQAFFLTSEFQSIQSLFGLEVKKEMLLDLIAEGKWEFFSSFLGGAPSNAQELPEVRRRALIQKYFDHNSPTAATLFLQTDFAYVIKKFDDAKILTLLSLLPEKNEYVKPLCLELLKSPRSDGVRRKSAEKLYAFLGETFPQNYSHDEVVARFFPHHKPLQKEVVSKEKNTRKESGEGNTYLVKEGDSPWKIARAHKVDLDELIRINHLQSKNMKPGKKIILPKKKVKSH